MTQRPEATLDIECFRNWFLVGVTDRASGSQWDFQMVEGTALDIPAIQALLQHFTIVTFNGNWYDLQMLCYALTGATCAQLKAANDDIIVNRIPPWTFNKKYQAYPPAYIDHIDIMEVAPGVRVSLKQYMCRMSSPLVQDSPVDFNMPLPMEHVPDEVLYCRNDRSGTQELFDIVAPRLEVRRRMSERYGVDLRSKSDAQMAEAMVKAEWSRRMAESIGLFKAATDEGAIKNLNWFNGQFPHLQVPHFDLDYYGNPKPIVPHFIHGTTFKARIPDYIEFVTPQMQDLLNVVRNCDFFISDKEEAVMIGLEPTGLKTGVMIPPELKGRDIVIGRSTYRVGIGGLHSQESSVSYKTCDRYTLVTADVASYYPSLIINAAMNPPQLGPLFTDIYTQFYKERLAAKRDKNKYPKGSSEQIETHAIESGFKIVLNGTFGKLFNRYSIFYAPEFGIAVTMGGQLSLLMLIERLELSGISVISANTDGIEMAVPKGYKGVAHAILEWWQQRTALALEIEDYVALYARDVNAYIRVDRDGSVKRKGAYGESGVMAGPQGKHPDCDVCSDAVVAYLTQGKPLRESIFECKDIRKFIRVRGVKGGAIYSGVNLGRVVRWYYQANNTSWITDGASGNKVAGSDGAAPVMRLPDELPPCIDYNRYIKIAEDMLHDIGCDNPQ